MESTISVNGKQINVQGTPDELASFTLALTQAMEKPSSEEKSFWRNETYYSESTGEEVYIEDMDFHHLVNAFTKKFRTNNKGAGLFINAAMLLTLMRDDEFVALMAGVAERYANGERY